ncbi:unnamed protein product [Fraxinus pennsylvanica]|uniref:F-box associated beta-propeller type 1 domain-containing protein n=1 Tax=Fraxinus pennsylvanica TaxID=56036 RepID=A0AAD1ZKQ7_9LAMI|nr:unnamed protein product [Fraxinus pennsylvanica]
MSSNNNIYSHNSLILGRSSDSLDLCTCPLYDETEEIPSMDIVLLDCPLFGPVTILRIVGSCYGLVCLVLDLNTVIILNPATRKSREFPISSINVFDTEYGLAYDESTDEYKVVEVSCTIDGLDEIKTLVQVYSSKSDSCRIINGPPGFVFTGCNVFVNVAIHWKVLYSRNNLRDWFIVAHGITTDRLELVRKPKYETGIDDAMLIVSGERLCVSLSYQTKIDIWILREDGNEEYCTKLVRIPYYLDHSNNHYIKPNPLLILGNGEVLLSYGSYIMMYEPFKTCEVHTFDENIEFEAATYTESFVSTEFRK